MATAVAAMMARARREIDELFFDNDAFSPERAVDVAPRMRVQQRYLDRLIAEGVVREASPGRYWLDLPAYREQRHDRFVWKFRILLLAAVVLVLVFAIQRMS